MTRLHCKLAAAALALVAGVSHAASPPSGATEQTGSSLSDEASGSANPAPAPLAEAQGMVMLDYQVVPVRGGKSIDLMGFHLFNKVNDWMYLGVGGHAPLAKGEYGGFMVFDVAAHAQRRIFGDVFANAGVALGGGGGGKSVQQSRILSGTGGFVKAYVGLGIDFKDFSAGANVSRVKFIDSAIDHSQLNLFVQVPFSYAVGSYADAGRRLSAPAARSSADAASNSSESILTFGLDNLFQIDPQGTNKGTINNIDLQYSKFFSNDAYWFFNAGGGYRGRPLYNQVFGGLGYRARISPSVNLYGQVGVGSGGYAPEIIDTGPGLLVYPKLSAEYMVTPDLGISLSAGYLVAPRGSSKNYTVGALLNYHLHSANGGARPDAATGGLLRGYRVNLFHQTESNVRFRGNDEPDIRLLTMQVDGIVDDHFYIPVQVGVAYTAYLTFPGYGEVLAGLGVQSRHGRNDRFQVFGQLLVGANPHGPIVKTGVGLNFGLSDRLAVYAMVGQTLSGLGASKEKKFRAEQFGLGLTYRFSVPSW